ncbi:MAG TPA: hypothetical protein VGW78_04010 [Candidatus Babeliales bacterium]|jgi:hypothetical protein|nr:hypothetical protein [Candidatus Babeliales bacterium]
MYSHKQTAYILFLPLLIAHATSMHAMGHDKKELFKWGAITGGVILFGTAMYQLGKRSGTIDKQSFDSKQFGDDAKKFQQHSTNTKRPFRSMQENKEEPEPNLLKENLQQNTDDSVYANFGRAMEQVCNDSAPEDQKEIWNRSDNLTDKLNAQYKRISGILKALIPVIDMTTKLQKEYEKNHDSNT